MSRRLSIPPSSADQGGFTLLEGLVALTITAIVLTAFVQLVLTTSRYRREAAARLEVEQGVGSVVESLTRDIRGAGACSLPVNALPFIPLSATNNGTLDTITTRSGRLLPNAVGCIPATTLSAAIAAGATQLDVPTTANLAANMRIYLVALNLQSGEAATIQSVVSATRLQTTAGVSRAYAAGSGVLPIDERTYAIDSSLGPLPVLTITFDGQSPPQRFATGITGLDLQYRLKQNCTPNCDVVNLPTAAQWPLVIDVTLTVSGRQASGLQPGQSLTLTETVRAKPRNLLP